jgi:hypothetical protein
MKKEVPIGLKTNFVTTTDQATKPNRLMLFREITSVYCENHMKHVNTVCGKNYGLMNGKTSGDICDLKFPRILE